MGTSSCVFSYSGNLSCHLSLAQLQVPVTTRFTGKGFLRWDFRVPEAESLGQCLGEESCSPQLSEHFVASAPQVPCLCLECSNDWLRKRCSSNSHSKISLIMLDLNQCLCVGGDGVGCDGLQSSWLFMSLPVFPNFSFPVLGSYTSLFFREKHIAYAHLLRQIGTQGCNQSTSSPKIWLWHGPCFVWLCISSVSTVVATKVDLQSCGINESMLKGGFKYNLWISNKDSLNFIIMLMGDIGICLLTKWTIGIFYVPDLMISWFVVPCAPQRGLCIRHLARIKGIYCLDL